MVFGDTKLQMKQKQGSRFFCNGTFAAFGVLAAQTFISTIQRI